MIRTRITCPLCSGTGTILIKSEKAKNKAIAEWRGTAARHLRRQGCSYREIMRLLGLKSTRSVSIYLGKYKRKKKEVSDDKGGS